MQDSTHLEILNIRRDGIERNAREIVIVEVAHDRAREDGRSRGDECRRVGSERLVMPGHYAGVEVNKEGIVRYGCTEELL